MSAFLCNAEHIGQLARFYAARNPGRESAEQVARTLATANLVSVEERYRLPAGTVAADFGFDQSDAAYIADCARQSAWLDHGLTPVKVLKMAQCLNYQSCEVDGWRDTEAYGLIEAIKSAAIRALPGYDDAPWEYRGAA